MLELDHVGFSYGKRLILDNASALFKEGSTTANGTFRLRKDHFAAFDGRFFTTRHWLRHH